MSKSKTLFYLSFCFIIGVFLGSLSQLFWLGFFLFLTVSIILLRKKIIILFLCLSVSLIGIWYFRKADNKEKENQLAQYYQNEVLIQGTIVKEPEMRIGKNKFVIRSERIKIDNNWQDISERILITTKLYPKYKYGDKLEITGELKQPAQFEDFDYKEYLTKDKIYSVIYYPQIKLISANQGNIFYQSILSFKDKLRKSIDKILLPPRSSILKAVFLGDKYSLSDNLKEKLNLTGTRHIVAISGMHMIIMVEILMSLALAAGLWRNQAFYLVISLLVVYILMIGAPSSAVRAGIMAGLLLFAQKIGRLNSSGRAITVTAFLMLIFNPLLLKIDVGFQLSFIACLGIVYLKPILDNLFFKLPNYFNLRDILTLTLAAQVGVLPILIFHFGQVSLISPLANILIVPLLPFLMIGGMIVSFVVFIYLPLAKLLAYPVYLLLGYLIKTINLLADFPLAGFELKNISWIILVGYYLILFYFLKKKKAVKS